MKKFLPTSTTLSVNKSKGFTLVELLVVVAIIAVLSVIGITIFSGVQKNARDARRKADVDSISKALEVHANTFKDQYCTGAVGIYCAPQPSWFASGAIPVDPLTGLGYAGLPANGATSYNVCALLLDAPGTCSVSSGITCYCQSNQQ